MSDSIISSAKSGNVVAINSLLTQTRGYAISVVSAFLGTKYSARIDAEDVSQIVLVQVARDLANCQATDWSGYLGWVSLIARNSVYKEVERVKAAKRSADRTCSIGYGDKDDSDPFQVTGPTATPVAIAEVREQLEQVLALAAGISESTKNVIALLAEGNTSEEIADQLGITVSGVYGVLKRFRSAARAECLV